MLWQPYYSVVNPYDNNYGHTSYCIATIYSHVLYGQTTDVNTLSLFTKPQVRNFAQQMQECYSLAAHVSDPMHYIRPS